MLPAPRARKVRRVSKVLPVRKVNLVPRVPKDLRVNKARKEKQVLKALSARRVNKVLPAWASLPSQALRAAASKRPIPSTIPMALPPPLW